MPFSSAHILSEYRGSGRANNAVSLAAFLVEAGLLTKYQAERALAGEANRLALGPYILIEPIGSGSLGTVYLAVGRSDRKRYAVKVLPLRSLWNVHLAKQQVQVFTNLPAHPAVVPFMDVDSAGGFHYMAWPFVQGQTLATVVQDRGSPPIEETVRTAAQIAEGLLLCHTHAVAHGLLKPSNILIGNDGQARILDLGIGAILSENIADAESMLDTISTANAAIGMLDYAAPETLNSPTLRAPSGDIYSFGCVLYFLLTGGMPFPDGNAVDKVLAHQSQTPCSIRSRNGAVPVWLESLTLAMMAKAAADRPETADVLAALLAGDYTPRGPTPKEASTTLRQSPTPWLQPSVATETLSSLDAPNEPTESSMFLSESELTSDPTDPMIGFSDRIVVPARVPIFEVAAQRQSLLNDLATAEPEQASTTHLLELPPEAGQASVAAATSRAPESVVEMPPQPPFARSFWHRLFKQLCFWKPHADIVQLSVFGPQVIRPGDNVSLQVFAHMPEAFASVRTLSKVFHQNGQLLATGYVQREVYHGQKLGLHLGVVNVGVDRSEVELTWRGQPQPRKFDLHVPWESPAGPSPTVLSAGLDHILSGRIAFTLRILPRKA